MKVRSSNWLLEGGATATGVVADASVTAGNPLAAGVGDSVPAVGDGDSNGRKDDEGERAASTRAVAVCHNGDGVLVAAGTDERGTLTPPRVTVHACRKSVELMSRSGRPVNRPCRLMD